MTLIWLLSNEAIATAVSDGISSLIGNETLATSFNDKVEGSTLFAFLEANQALFGGSELNLEKSIEPKEISANKYDMPKNVSQLIDNPENNSGSFVKYTYLAQESNYLVNLDKWQALYAKIKAEADTVLAEVDAINEKIATLESQIKDENAALWQAELACYLLKAISRNAKTRFSQKATLTKSTILLTSKNHFWVMS